MTPSRSYRGQRAAPLLLDVLRLVADGCTNDEIARRLRLSPNTVKDRLRGLYRDLEARDRAHAVAIAFRTGLLDAAAAHARGCVAARPRPCDCGLAAELESPDRADG